MRTELERRAGAMPEGLRRELWALLARQAARYTRGRSSSVSEGAARELMESICFTLGLDPNAGSGDWARLERLGVEEAFRLGQAALAEEMERGRALYRAVRENMPRLRSRSLEDTVGSIGTFWRRYDRELLAHQIPCDIDYQLSLPVPEHRLGVLYVNEYLRRLWMEQDLLRRFDWGRTSALLARCCGDYTGLLVNLWEPVAVNAMGLVLAGRDPFALSADEEVRAELVRLLLLLKRAERLETLERGACRLADALALEQPAQRRYLTEEARALLPRLTAALEHGDLSGVFFDFTC